MKNNNMKTIICAILIIISLIAVITSTIWALVFQFMNPDMTELRLFLENPYPTIITLASVVIVMIASAMMKER